MNSIHDHEVLNMMIKSGEQYTHVSPEAAIKVRFGEQARFHTCSAEGVIAGELVALLAAEGKFIPSEEGFSTDQSKIYRHRFETVAENLPPESTSFVCRG